MAALTAVKSFGQRLAGRQGGLTYEVDVVAQHAELPLPPGTRAIFLLKRRHRLCVTDPSETTTLFKEGGAAGGWRPKEFVFKVQAMRGASRAGQGEAVTVAKASLDLSQFCQAEPFGPKQVVLPLQPAGILCVSVRTQWLQHFDQEADTLTDISHLSLAQSAATSIVGAMVPPAEAEAEQDLSGFDGSTAVAAAEAVERLYDSEEEPTPKSSVMGTMRRMFGRALNATPGTTARQLHATFGTPAPTPPRCTPDPAEVATIDRDASLSTLRRRCKRLLVERDEARAEGYAEAALAVEQGVEIDRLRRAKEMLLGRLHTTEEQLLATFRDEASTDLIQALAAARVEAAQCEFQALELQGQLRRRDAVIDRLRAQLTRAEAKYRASINAMSPGAKGLLPPSPLTSVAALPSPPAAAAASSQAGVGAAAAGDTAAQE